VIANFPSFAKKINRIFQEVLESVKGGKNASYIPALANVDSSKFSLSVCSVDGQKLNLGDFNEEFCIQSCSKIFS